MPPRVRIQNNDGVEVVSISCRCHVQILRFQNWLKTVNHHEEDEAVPRKPPILSLSPELKVVLNGSDWGIFISTASAGFRGT